MPDDELLIELDEHPARQQIPVAPGREPVSVPTFPDQKLIRVEGVGVAYLSLKSGGISYITRQYPAVIEAVEKFVKQHVAELEEKELVSSQPPIVDSPIAEEN